MKNIFLVKSIGSIVLKLCVVISMAIGLGHTIRFEDFTGKSSSFLYFTIQSNIWIGITCLIFAVLAAVGLYTKKNLIKNWLYILKFMFTVAITLTFIVMALLLTPEAIARGDYIYLASPGNIFNHYITPILAIIDFALFDTAWKNRWINSFYAAIMPFYYLIFALICSFSGVIFSSGEKVPYFFLNYDKLTWFQFTSKGPGVFWWIIILTVFDIGMGFGFIAINKWMKRTKFAGIADRYTKASA